MKITALVLLFIFLYLRRPIKKILANRKINYLLGLYDIYRKANTQDDKLNAFENIARNRSMSSDLFKGVYISFPSYRDFGDEEKIHSTCITLIEKFDSNLYWMKKYLHPKYVVKDIFFMPAAIFGFLVNHEFQRISSFLLSSLGWLATVIISAYASEIRLIIDALIKKFI